MSKISDAILTEFGFDLAHLAKASRHFDLDANKELQSFRRIVEAQQESEEQKEYERAQPPQEMLDQLVEEGLAFGQPQIKQDGSMTFNYFLQTSKLIAKYVAKHTAGGLESYATQRRAALTAGNQDEFHRLSLETINWEQRVNEILEATLYQALQVHKDIVDHSSQMYMMEPSKRTIYEEEMQALKDSMRTRTPRELTREQIVDCVRRLEAAKLVAQKKMYEFVKRERASPQMVNAVIKVEQIKADDVFFNETGIEEEDVEPSIKRLGLEQDPELKGIIDDYKRQSDEYLSG